jgi:EAL domain-containing protein (putative c-di-GMP-specific phosphodiesterase class I)
MVERRSAFVAALLPLVRQAGVTVLVDGIGSAEQARWWLDAGADFATGDHFGVAREPGDFLEGLEPR